MPELRPWNEMWWLEGEERRSIDQKSICHFGIKSLDDQIPGILKNDLIVIGADSGAGKSDVALSMAVHNASVGKQVALYFIEGGALEAIARIKWKEIRDIYYTKYRSGIEMDYIKWRLNIHDCPETLKEIEKEAEESISNRLKDNLQMYSFRAGFTIDDLTKSLESTGEVDLIVIDHLQYFTLVNPRNEYQEMTEIVKRVKEITENKQIPVVLVSHLRKKDKDRGLPNQEDFFGTSNIAKICSLAFTITPATSVDDHEKEIYPTYFRVVKSRSGIRTSLATLNKYDFKRGFYLPEYEVWRLVGDHPKDQLTGPKLPRWARRKDEQERRIPNEKPRYESELRDEGGIHTTAIQREDNIDKEQEIKPEQINWND